MGQGTEYEIEEAYEYYDLDIDRKAYNSLSPRLKAIDMKIVADMVREKPVGSVVYCPVCNKKFTKKTKTHTFCSNGRNRKGGNCKDKYWNTVDEILRERAGMFS